MTSASLQSSVAGGAPASRYAALMSQANRDGNDPSSSSWQRDGGRAGTGEAAGVATQSAVPYWQGSAASPAAREDRYQQERGAGYAAPPGAADVGSPDRSFSETYGRRYAPRPAASAALATPSRTSPSDHDSEVAALLNAPASYAYGARAVGGRAGSPLRSDSRLGAATAWAAQQALSSAGHRRDPVPPSTAASDGYGSSAGHHGAGHRDGAADTSRSYASHGGSFSAAALPRAPSPARGGAAWGGHGAPPPGRAAWAAPSAGARSIAAATSVALRQELGAGQRSQPASSADPAGSGSGATGSGGGYLGRSKITYLSGNDSLAPDGTVVSGQPSEPEQRRGQPLGRAGQPRRAAPAFGAPKRGAARGTR